MPLSELALVSKEGLDSLRALSDANMPHTAIVAVLATTGVRVGGALPVPSYTRLLTDAPCRLTPGGNRISDSLVAGQPTPIGAWWLTFTAGTDIPPGAIALVTGEHPDGTAWTRALRVLQSQSAAANEVAAKYQCEDSVVGADALTG